MAHRRSDKDSEFGDQAATIAAQLVDLAVNDQIAAACRGSGNPVALAWLAENLRLNDVSMVVDVGAGLGGPSAWMRARYGCRIVAIEPEEQAARAASSIFGLPTIVGAASHSSIASDTFDSALLLGVVSVVDDPDSVLSEAHRIAYTLGLIDYCSTGSDAVRAGGSTFRTERQLRELVAATWRIRQFAAVSVEAPDTWTRASDAVHADPDPDEADVLHAIERDLIAPIMLVATR